VRSLRQTYILRVWNGAPPHTASMNSASSHVMHGAEVEGPYSAPKDAPSGAAGDVLPSEVVDRNMGENQSGSLDGRFTPSADSKVPGDVTEPESAERFYCSLQAVASEEIHYFATLEETMRFLRNNALAFRFKQK
jgi:hypothetical protein